MLRKITAMSFILVMVSILALKHPAFAYCLCEHKIIPLTECSHMKELAEQPPKCPHCAAKEAEEKPPLDDCSLEITFDAGFFFWQDSTESPHPPFSLDTPVMEYHEIHLPVATVTHLGCTAQQNAPPPRPPLPSLTGVYRL